MCVCVCVCSERLYNGEHLGKLGALRVPRLPACPSGKGIEQRKEFGSEAGKVMRSGLLGVCSRGKKLGTWAEFCVWVATL
jgi:hypothetical protein